MGTKKKTMLLCIASIVVLCDVVVFESMFVLNTRNPLCLNHDRFEKGDSITSFGDFHH